jgi:hypothetical protein
MDSTKKFETLDTSYVNLAALIRYLRQQKFTGRLHVVLDQYDADVLLDGESQPNIEERDHLSGRNTQGQEAFERLLVRAREPGGLITVYQNAVVKTAPVTESKEIPSLPEPSPNVVKETRVESDSLLIPAGELIAAIERAVQGTGTEFADLFRSMRVELGDDYSFLDPSLGGFEYGNGEVSLHAKPSRPAFVNGVVEALRRVVNKVATSGDEARFRERVAVELAVAARRRANLSDFASRLDQIAGIRVL